jgi:hypothetical protein
MATTLILLKRNLRLFKKGVEGLITNCNYYGISRSSNHHHQQTKGIFTTCGVRIGRKNNNNDKDEGVNSEEEELSSAFNAFAG